jgi:hypothetical protein
MLLKRNIPDLRRYAHGKAGTPGLGGGHSLHNSRVPGTRKRSSNAHVAVLNPYCGSGGVVTVKTLRKNYRVRGLAFRSEHTKFRRKKKPHTRRDYKNAWGLNRIGGEECESSLRPKVCQCRRHLTPAQPEPKKPSLLLWFLRTLQTFKLLFGTDELALVGFANLEPCGVQIVEAAEPVSVLRNDAL